MSINTRNGGSTTSARGEYDPLLSSNSSKAPRRLFAGRLRRHLNQDVSLERTDLILLYAYFVTGLLDTSATAIWGTFVSMQTGNTVFLALGLAGPATSSRWIKSGMSLLFFCLGSFFFARFHNAISLRRRWILLLGVLIQVLCIIAAALIVTFTQATEPGSDHDLHWKVLLPLALVAFQSSGQAVVSRTLRHRTLTSVALTSIYCDLFSDAELFSPGLTTNIERNRRVAAALLLFLGALVGGAWSRFGIGMTGALWTAAVVKSLNIVAWLAWKAEKEEEESDE
ncbi:hypothetical protein BX600DRAFT_514701 [Xylariales sp. PMI_506]|nr:hypothetical protein BX600DRAFT_514701 [Xylariales sp. PMI_506]